MSEIATAQTDAQTAAMRASKPATGARHHSGPRKPYIDRFPSRPFVPQSARFASVSAKKLYDRAYARVDSALYGISMVLRITGGEDGAASVEQIVDEHLAAVARDLAAEQARLRLLGDESGVTIKVEYTKPITVDAHVSSPRSMRFLGMCRDLDALIGTIDCLWIAGVLNDRQHSQAVYLWQQRLVKLASRLIGIAGRAFAAARRQGKVAEDGEIGADTAVDTAEIDAAEDAAIAAEAAADGEAVASDGTEAIAGEAPKRGRKKKATPPADGPVPDDNVDIAASA